MLRGKRLRIGRRSFSAGLLTVVGGILLLAGGGVYAALQLGAEQNNSVNLQSGLAGWWKFDGNATDSSGNGNNATANGATLATDRKGTANQAYSFNGTTNYLGGPSGTTGSTLSFTTTFSISTWVNPTAYHTAGYFGLKNMILARGPATTYNYGMQITDATTVTFIKRTGAEGIQFYNFTGVPSLTNQWTLITATVSGTQLKLYVNGNLFGTTTVGSIAPGSNDALYMGTGGVGNSEMYFTGSLDDMRIYNRTLNSAEAKALYRERNSYLNAASGEKGLIGWWKLDGNAKDATPYQNNGTFTGGSMIADRKGASIRAYSFNASGSKMLLTSPVGQAGLMTASVWYKRNDAASASANWRTILGHQSANIHPLIVRITTNTLCIFDGGTRDFGYTVPNDNTWHNYSVIYDSSGTASLYVDGGFYSQITTTLNLGVNPIGTIGNWSAGNYWAGDIDDVRIYNRALSAAEIQRLYQSYNSQINLNSSPSTSAATGNFNSGQAGYWPFSGNARDATPYSNNGTVTDATLTADRKGRLNNAYLFNGTSANITANLMSAITKAGNYTVSAWIKTTNTGVNQTVFQNSANCSDRNGMGVNGNQAYFAYYDGTAYTGKVGSIVAGQWNHLVGVDTGGTLTFYINGVAQGTSSSFYSHCQIGLWIGSTSATSATPQWFNGSIDEFRVWNRALSAAEVQALYAN